MRVIATGDIDRKRLETFVSDLEGALDVQLDGRTKMFKSLEPPSFIDFFATAPWWVQGLGALAAAYVAGLAEEAGKQTWKERARLVRAVVDANNKIARLARALNKLRSGGRSDTKLGLALPVPDDYFGTRVELLGKDDDVIAAEIALFVHHLPKLEQLIEAEGLKAGRATGPVILMIEDDASMRVHWMDRKSLDVQERRLSFEGGASSSKGTR